MKKMLRSLLSLALCLVLVTALTIPASAESLDDFTDADTVDYAEAIAVLVGLNILDSVETAGQSSAGTFTRAMLATLIARFQLGREGADALPAPATAPFSDVGVDDPDAPVIAYCKEQGIIDGHGDGLFDPNGAVTPLATAKMLLAALGYGGGHEGFTGVDWEANVGSLAIRTGLVRDASISLNSPIAEKMQEELEIIPASFSATAAMLLAAAEMPRVEYTDVEAPTTPVASTTVYTVSVTDGATDDGGTAASMSKLISSDKLTVTRTIPAEAFSAPSLGGAQYVVADEAATMPEGKAVGYRENDNDKTLYLSDEDALALLALVQNITPEQFAQFSALFGSSATYPDGTTTDDDPTEWLSGFTAEQGLVDMFVGFVGDSLTAPVQVGANIYSPVTGTVTNAYTDEQTVVADAVKYAAEASTLPEASLSGDILIGTRDGVPQYAAVTADAVAIPLERGFDGLKVESGGRDPFGRPQTVYRSGDATETVTRKPELTYTDEAEYVWLREGTTEWFSLDAFTDIDYYVDGVLTEGVITLDRLLTGAGRIPTTGKGSLTEVYIEKTDPDDPTVITKLTVVTITAPEETAAPEEYTMRHIAVATLKANDDGSAKLTGREITDADIEAKQNGDIALLKGYADYPWTRGIEIPADVTYTRVGATPAQFVVTFPDGGGEAEVTPSALGTIPVGAEQSEGGTTFLEDVGGNTAGWTYVFTLCYDEDGNLAKVYQFDEPIAYPVGTTGGGSSGGGSTGTCSCSEDNVDDNCFTICHPGGEENATRCGCPDCWCQYSGEEIEE